MPTWPPTAIVVPLIGFGLYRRFRRTFGRQLVTPRRMVLRIVLLSAVCTLSTVTSSPTLIGLLATAAGLVSGVVLAVAGLRLTKFEATNEGGFYVPNGWIGIAVTALFLGRLAARLFTMSERMAAVQAGTSPLAGLQRSPLTLGLFFLLAGTSAITQGSCERRACWACLPRPRRRDPSSDQRSKRAKEDRQTASGKPRKTRGRWEGRPFGNGGRGCPVKLDDH